MRSTTLKPTLRSVAAAGLLAGTAIFMSLPSRDATAQAAGVYINAVDLVVIPSEMPKFLEAIKENGGIEIDYHTWNPVDDEKTQDFIRRGDTIGCFYIESPATRLRAHTAESDADKCLRTPDDPRCYR